MNKFSKSSKRNMKGVDSRLIEIASMAILISPIDFGIPSTGGIRTAEQQLALFNDSKSKADGYVHKSSHQSGLAIDVYAYVYGSASWEPQHLTMIACAMLQSASVLGYKLHWGGLWVGFTDMPHFQLVD